MDIHKELPLPRMRSWTRDEYERAVNAGVFAPDERLELLEGIIVCKRPQNGPHASGIRLCARALEGVFAVGHDVRNQLPLALGQVSEPEPDVAVVTGSIRDYVQSHPTTAVLVVEVSDSSLSVDRTTKASIYAKAGIPEYWVLNLPERCLEVSREPGPDREQPLGFRYRTVRRYDDSTSVSPMLAAESMVRVADLLP